MNIIAGGQLSHPSEMRRDHKAKKITVGFD